MKKGLFFLISVLFTGLATVVSAQEFSEDDLHDMGVKKTDIIDQIIHFTPAQKSDIVFIIMKYDDLAASRNTPNFAIGAEAERQMMATFTEDQLANYNNNSETIYYNLITAYGKAPVPAATDNSSSAAPEKSRKKRRAKQ
ncbi:MAG: hypothetical protein RL213_906 [Bacteroidota bacterium]|jgi:hypothetical protein